MTYHQENAVEASDTQENNISTVISIDYSTTRISYSIWEDSNFVQSGEYYPTEEYSPSERITEIYEWLEKVFQTVYDNRGSLHVAIADTTIRLRKSFTNTTPSVLLFKRQSQLMGVIIHLCVSKGYTYEIVRASEWKHALGIESRSKDAQKDEQIIAMDSEGIKTDYETVDAVCIGYCIAKEKL